MCFHSVIADVEIFPGPIKQSQGPFKFTETNGFLKKIASCLVDVLHRRYLTKVTVVIFLMFEVVLYNTKLVR